IAARLQGVLPVEAASEAELVRAGGGLEAHLPPELPETPIDEPREPDGDRGVLGERELDDGAKPAHAEYRPGDPELRHVGPRRVRRRWWWRGGGAGGCAPPAGLGAGEARDS